jgi:hypothetical protein
MPAVSSFACKDCCCTAVKMLQTSKPVVQIQFKSEEHENRKYSVEIRIYVYRYCFCVNALICSPLLNDPARVNILLEQHFIHQTRTHDDTIWLLIISALDFIHFMNLVVSCYPSATRFPSRETQAVERQ